MSTPIPADKMIKRTVSGQYVDLLDPNPNTIRIKDIAIGLSNMCRWGGQVDIGKFMSVAQHSVLCSYKTTDPSVAMGLLLHDAAEYLVGDVFPPMKKYYGIDIIEDEILKVIFAKYNVPYTEEMWNKIKVIDKQGLVTEKRDIIGSERVWEGYENVVPWEDVITPWSITVTFNRFMTRFQELRND